MLSTAASDGRLTLEEYSGRADRVLEARLLDELAELTADLKRPAEPLVPSPDRAVAPAPEQMVAILSSDSRRGRWTVPAQLDARSVLGDCHIELQEAVLTSHVTTIDARATLGSVKIFVPEGVEVRMSGKAILGSKDSHVTEAARPGSPVIEVRARAILGSVDVFPAPIPIASHIRRALTGGDDRS